MKLEFSGQIFETYSNTKFHENPSSGSRVLPCGRADMTKLTVAFRNFANAPQKAENEINRQISKNGTQAAGKRKWLYQSTRRHTQPSWWPPSDPQVWGLAEVNEDQRIENDISNDIMAEEHRGKRSLGKSRNRRNWTVKCRRNVAMMIMMMVVVIIIIIIPLNTGSSKKMDGIWNRYNLKSTGRIYTFGVLKCSEKIKVLDLP